MRKSFKQRRKLSRKRGFKIHFTSRLRMGEMQPQRVQEQAFQPQPLQALIEFTITV